MTITEDLIAQLRALASDGGLAIGQRYATLPGDGPSSFQLVLGDGTRFIVSVMESCVPLPGYVDSLPREQGEAQYLRQCQIERAALMELLRRSHNALFIANACEGEDIVRSLVYELRCVLGCAEDVEAPVCKEEVQELLDELGLGAEGEGSK